MTLPRLFATPSTAWALLLLGAALLLFPGLGRFGLWEPAELKVARQAAHLGGAASEERLTFPAAAYLPALGLRVLGSSETAARLPGALLALATLAAVALAGATLFDRRTGFLAVLVLAGFPAFALQARQLTSDVPVLLGSALALAGFGALARGALVRGAALVLAGLGVATLFGGVLVGALPLLGAGALAFGLGDGERKTRSRPVAIATAVPAVVLALLVLSTRYGTGEPSLLLGGRPGGGVATFAQLIEVLGFGLFPLGALGLLSFALLAREADFAPLLLLFAAALGLGLSVVQLQLLGQARLTCLPAVALAIAGGLTRLGPDQPLPDLLATRGLALLAGVGAVLVARDASLAPESLLSVHLPQSISWPPALSIKTLVMAVGVTAALGLVLLLTETPARTLGLPLVLAPGLVLCFALCHGVVPALSPYVSSKAVLDAFARLAPPGAALSLYHVNVDELAVFDREATRAITSPHELVAQLRAEPASFALVPRAELTTLDTTFAAADVAYTVADDSSARHLLLTGARPTDRNPLRAHVWHAAMANAPRPVWADRRVEVAPLATFGGAIDLLAADYPREVRRGQELPLTLLLRVVAQPPAGYRVFVHLELPGEPLLNGNHDPVEGTFATQHWRPGDVIRDRHDIELPRVTTQAGSYRLLVGFWPGGDTPVRLPITAGRNDGLHRAELGRVFIR